MAEFPTFKGTWPWPWRWIGSLILHTTIHHSSASTYISNVVEVEETFCGRTDVRTGGRTFEIHFIRSTQRSRPNNVFLTYFIMGMKVRNNYARGMWSCAPVDDPWVFRHFSVFSMVHVAISCVITNVGEQKDYKHEMWQQVFQINADFQRQCEIKIVKRRKTSPVYKNSIKHHISHKLWFINHFI